MANTIKLKRSAVPGKIPAVGDLQLGELGLNTYDGRLYTKKNVSGTESIISLSGIRYSFDAAAPSNPVAGDEWTDSGSGITYKYLNDGNTSQWFEFGPGSSSNVLTDVDGGAAATIYTAGAFTTIDGGAA